MLAASTIGEKYQCPGEPYAISESVHLSRLAAGYSKCRICLHRQTGRDVTRGAAGGIADDSAEITEQVSLTVDLSTDRLGAGEAEGIRGRYLNEINRASAGDWAGALARWLWDNGESEGGAQTTFNSPDCVGLAAADLETSADFGPTADAGEGIRLLEAARPGLCVVLAQDERPSSPDLAVGAGQALRRMGCEVIDLGASTRPTLMFAVNHLQAAGAVMITGAGCDPGWTGFDFIVRRGIPASSPGMLETIHSLATNGFARAGSRSGLQRPFPARPPYEAGLWKHFHALRPLKIAFGCSSNAVREIFSGVFRKLACRLIPVEIPSRARRYGDRGDPDVVRVSQAVNSTSADLGVLIEEDGETCTVFDERGQVVDGRIMSRIFLREIGSESSIRPRLVLPAEWSTMSAAETEVAVARPTRESVTQAMLESRGDFGTDGRGRYWFSESRPVCDGILTLAKLLRALSHSDALFSEVASH